ncbi:hypothetical protein HDU96_004617 [Phlyctochytrium bullatum]|nr:hypothetical protein HDU96_004617 [Phlyctochytrium bullatum]
MSLYTHSATTFYPYYFKPMGGMHPSCIPAAVAPPKSSRPRSASESFPPKGRGDRYVPRGFSSSHIPLPERPPAVNTSRSGLPHRHHVPKSATPALHKSPTSVKPKEHTPGKSRRRRPNSYYATRRKSAAALARSLKEEKEADPESRLDLDRDRLVMLMQEAGLSPIGSNPVTREDLLNEEDESCSGTEDEYEGYFDNQNELSTAAAAAAPSSLSLNLDRDIDEAFADLGLSF